MQDQLKSISKAGIPEAIAKAELYRYLNEPEEAESICRDILAVDPDEAQSCFQSLRDSYERLYYSGLLHERRAKAQLLVGYAPHILLPLVEEAMHCFAEAEKIRPAGNDDSILRWNRCVRLLESRPDFHVERAEPAFDTADAPPITSSLRRAGGNH